MGSRVGRGRLAGGCVLEELRQRLEAHVQEHRSQDCQQHGDDLELVVAGVARVHAHGAVPGDPDCQQKLEQGPGDVVPVAKNLLHDVLLKGARLFPPRDSNED